MPGILKKLRATLLNLLVLVVTAGGMLLVLEGAVRWLDLFPEARLASHADRGGESGDGEFALEDESSPADAVEPDLEGLDGGHDFLARDELDATGTDGPADEPTNRTAAERSARRYGRYADRTLIHPFLGWSPRPRTEDHRGRRYAVPANIFGLRSRIHDYRELREEDFVVGIFGGSVARGVALNGERALVERLASIRPELAGRVVIANFATSGYKQPQQLFLLQEMLMLGIPFDAVISLDGFNELALGNESAIRGFHPLFPHRQFWAAAVALGSGRMSEEQIERMAEVLALKRRVEGLRQGLASSWRGRSELLRAVYGVLVQRLEGRAVLAEKALRELPKRRGRDPLANLDAPCLGERDTCLELIVSLWQRASLQIDALARAHDIVFVHALQPSQYVEGSKPLTPGELERAYDPEAPWSRSAIAGYPLLRAAGRELAEQGVGFVDLTQMFRDDTEELYRDRCCHFNQRGYRKIAARLAREVADRLPAPPSTDSSLGIGPGVEPASPP